MKAALILVLLFVSPIVFGQIKRTPEQDSLFAEMQRNTTLDHRNMMTQLGITSLRVGASGNASSPKAANYDESKAVLFPNLPALGPR